MKRKIKCGKNLRKANGGMENKTTVSILRIRRDIQKLCQKHSKGIHFLLKFIMATMLFLSINDLYGKTEQTALILAVVFGIVCIVLPLNATYLVSSILITMYLCQVSWDLVAFYLAFVFLSYLMICRIKPESAVIIAFTPLFFYLKVPFLLPLMVGMFSNLIGVGAMIFGVILYFFGGYIKGVEVLLSSTTGGDSIIAIKNIVDSFSRDQQCMLLLAAFVVSAVLMYVLYHQSFDYAWYVAILVGGLSGFFVCLAGGLVFDIQGRNLGYLASILISMLMAVIIQFFRCIIDYGSVEYIEFEDDEYYYYVKAVPKVTVIGEDFSSGGLGTEDRTVRRFKPEEDK